MTKSKFLVRQFFSKAMKRIALIFIIIFLNNHVSADDKKQLGLKVYNEKAMCGVCHTLKSAKSNGNIGPNLDQLKPSIEQIEYVVKYGNGVMQAWDGILTEEEIQAVAYYVFTNTNE